MNKEETLEIEDSRLELENRIRNLLWTVSGDYKLDMKPDVSLFLRSKAIALYDGIKQGALARFYDKDLLGLYLVKKVFLQADEGELTAVAQLCIEEAIGEKICEERPGIRNMQREAFEDILDQEFEKMPSQADFPGRLKSRGATQETGRGRIQSRTETSAVYGSGDPFRRGERYNGTDPLH